ncbi:SDR family oxidoreductase [Mucilaginibacter phyllosphaerae]|uniref:3-oxoacyl-[acyl-carrier protein] reductase n=1 Tax=Mucilaginibacter phyllosphaerae TaxID=1812349 RepID=A0A4Y8ABC1_9SPHI|nr:SDR family oxidoreductase [Mucilaginibacter phyllosphaerae]MBB3969760.1 3-oxoacyl-[acyl-carrier protein] reductase [Mucilaginibacter phyllosphaerae]TEW65141.1 SDR family oxidoreductase [Mucilaginibacter phyllosphaerae]GGH17710.1 short-chain dehydrogenase [Mucilaginibacter phyllosphaerae]
MDLKLTNKVAIVLAASKGLGKAIAMSLSAEGAKVIIGSRDEELLKDTAAEITQATGNTVLAIPVDVANATQVAEFISKAANAFGRIDILLNNAGGPPFDKFENFDDQQWQQAFDLNLLSMARTSRLVLPHLQKTGSGRIINIISGSVKTVLDNSVLSTAMRMGVVGMAKLMADEFGPYHITVNNVAPGLILTERIKHTLPKNVTPEEAMQQKTKAIPLGRIGKPQELAALVTFLASEQAAYISGQTIQVDGGAGRNIY